MPRGITQCYLLPGRGDIPAITPAEAGTRLSDPGGMQSWVDLIYQAGYLTVCIAAVCKFSILTVDRVYDKIRYHLNGTELPQSNICRDLGVTITSDLSPSQPNSEITLKAHQRANHIIRSFVSGDTYLLVRAFIVYVRPLLEYNSVIWSPSLIKDIDLIEQVQRRFRAYQAFEMSRWRCLYWKVATS